MRRGEVLGLCWDDMTFSIKPIYARRNMTYPPNQPSITSAKAENGIRQVPVDGNLIELLDRPAHAKGYAIGGRKPITLMVYRWMYEKIQKQMDPREATEHVLRHSSLTLPDAAGVEPKTLRRIAGHGDFMITMNRHVHGREKEISAAGAKLSSMMDVTLEPLPEEAKGQKTSAA